MLRFLLWRLLGLLALLVGFTLVVWCLHGGLGRAFRGSASSTGAGPLRAFMRAAGEAWSWRPATAVAAFQTVAALAFALATPVLISRWIARTRRRYVRMRIEVHRTDSASAEAVVKMFEALHKRILRRWWRRLVLGQPAVALEVHYTGAQSQAGSASSAWMALCCPRGYERTLEAALRSAYSNSRLSALEEPVRAPASLLRLKKDQEFIRRVKLLDRFEHEREPSINNVLTVMGAASKPVFLQIALTPAPVLFERLARRLFKMREERLSRQRHAHVIVHDRSLVEDVELRGGLDVQHRPLFFVDIRVAGADRATCELVASELRAESAENRLVERGTTIRHGVLSLYRRRLERGEGNPLAPMHRGVFATTELASIWHLPSIDYTTVPFARGALPLAPAPPSILRPLDGHGTLRDALGPVSIHPELRKQNVAVPGAVEQGKSSYLIATVAEDLRRERCAVIVLDPKGDAADAAVSLVPLERTCTLLDFAHPTCGFNPLAVDAPADVIADYVVAALKNLFTDADIRASSDRYLRNAIIAVIAFDRSATLWDAARLLSVGEEGYAYRRTVGSRVRTLPAYKEISAFFTSELTAQLADARSMTTAKLDAPVNKLARLLNSASIKRVLLNGSLTVDFDRVVAQREVLVVKGALGAMGAGNTSVLMQLLIGMLDAALARQQDMVADGQRIAVALKVDEAPLVLNRGFAETMALKRSAGLETVACWQSDAQWTDREVRDQLDALFAHRVYFATASTREARDAVGLTMAEFSDTVRPGIEHLSKLGRPDARLHLPKHHAIASWTTVAGRQAPFIARTNPLRVDRERIGEHMRRQHERGGRHLADLRQPHWQDAHRPARVEQVRAGPDPAGSSAPAGTPSDARGGVTATQRSHVSSLGQREPAMQPPPTTPAEAPAALPANPSESYRELVELDLAQNVRWARRPDSPRALDADPLDLAMLDLVANLRHVLSSQLHRRFNRGRAITTTQRRLKRLSDAGLVERFQFHRRDGGGVPMCYVITDRGMALLRATGGLGSAPEDGAAIPVGCASARRADEQRLRQARHDVHVAGWVLALMSRQGDLRCALRGPEQAVLSPPTRSTPAGRVAIAPADLRLPGGCVAHDFMRADGTGAEAEVERFETVRPHAIVELAPVGEATSPTRAVRADDRAEAPQAEASRSVSEVCPARGVDVIVELDDRLSSGRGVAKLQRYDHFLSGWSVHTRRYGQRREAQPLVVFVCRDRRRARECAQRADVVMRACRAYAGEYPVDWQYPGRERVLFVAERDMHEGLRRAFGVARLPPSVRVVQAHGNPQAGATSVQARELP
ncbi:MAG TPA: replication-relaxation family protein [Solirubrobacteraceae bacterium]|nr:replication-relaxation family protein [Solirubrobacteraceae bacterium]